MKDIIDAIRAIRAKVTPIGHDAQNIHGGYDYVSIDKYYETVARTANEAGLVWRTREIEFSFLEGQGRTKDRTYVKAKFAYDLYVGDQSCPDYMTVTVVNPLDGAQTTGQLYSYSDKVFMRVAFCVPTGEKDADANRQEAISVAPVERSASVASYSEPPPAHDPETGELLPASEDVISRIKDDLPLIDTRKVAGPSIQTIEAIFQKWLPDIKSRNKLIDWRAENLAAIEKVKEHDPAAYDRILDLFRQRFNELPGGKK